VSPPGGCHSGRSAPPSSDATVCDTVMTVIYVLWASINRLLTVYLWPIISERCCLHMRFLFLNALYCAFESYFYFVRVHFCRFDFSCVNKIIIMMMKMMTMMKSRAVCSLLEGFYRLLRNKILKNIPKIFPNPHKWNNKKITYNTNFYWHFILVC